MSAHDDVQYIETARRIWASMHGDDLEIDDNPKVSAGDDDGAWVAAWVWVPDDEVTPQA